MRTISIRADDTLFQTLEDLARKESKSVEAWTRQALSRYVRKLTAKRDEPATQGKKYSFVGIGRSGKGHLSTKVDEILAKGMNRREGWSLDE